MQIQYILNCLLPVLLYSIELEVYVYMIYVSHPITISRNLNMDGFDCNNIVFSCLAGTIFLAVFISYDPLDILFLQ